MGPRPHDGVLKSEQKDLQRHQGHLPRGQLPGRLAPLGQTILGQRQRVMPRRQDNPPGDAKILEAIRQIRGELRKVDGSEKEADRSSALGPELGRLLAHTALRRRPVQRGRQSGGGSSVKGASGQPELVSANAADAAKQPDYRIKTSFHRFQGPTREPCIGLSS